MKRSAILFFYITLNDKNCKGIFITIQIGKLKNLSDQNPFMGHFQRLISFQDVFEPFI